MDENPTSNHSGSSAPALQLQRDASEDIMRPLLARIELLEAQVQELQASRHVHALKLGLLGPNLNPRTIRIKRAEQSSPWSIWWVWDKIWRYSSRREQKEVGIQTVPHTSSLYSPVSQAVVEDDVRLNGILDPGVVPKHQRVELSLSPGARSRLSYVGVLLIIGQQASENVAGSRLLSMLSSPAKIAESRVQSAPTSLVAGKTRETELKTQTRITAEDNSPGFFHRSENLVFNQPNMFDVQAQNVYVQNERQEEALRWLKEYVMKGAEFDSYERDPPPHCHPGTRTTIIQRATEWLDNPLHERRLFWLRGPAGVGKSAIVQTLAEKLAAGSRLGASLFFSRPNRRTNPTQVFPSIAYQLAIQDPSYKEYITELMQKNPKSLEKALSEQFRILIIEPFAQRRIRNGMEVWVVTLDGLDECGGDPVPNGRPSDRVQCEIVSMISSFVLTYLLECKRVPRRTGLHLRSAFQLPFFAIIMRNLPAFFLDMDYYCYVTYPSVPLIWIIASRPETHLKTIFGDDAVKPSFWEEDVPVNSDEACLDVEKYLNAEFIRIKRSYPTHFDETPWPSNIQFLHITTAALGLFIFAEVVIRFVDSPTVKNPVAQLERILMALKKSNVSSDNPLVALDLIYIEILSKLSPDVFQVAKRLIASFIFLDRNNYRGDLRTLRDICNFLNIPKDIALTSLNYLHSVLHFPKDIGSTRPQFYHASFRDFLEDPTRSGEYAITPQDIGVGFFLGSVRLTAAALDFAEVKQAWPKEGSSVGWTIDNAKDQFRAILTGDLSSGTGIGIKFSAQFVIPDQHLRSLFETVNISKMVQIDTGSLWWPLDLSDAMTEELQRRGFLTRVPLGSLDLKKVDIAKSFVYAHPSRHVLIHLDRKKPGPERLTAPDEAMVDALLQCIQVAPDTMVTRWGYSDPARRCVAMKVEDLSSIWPVGGPRLRPLYITGL
ncbi:hypothetical protein AN958_00726 [Leucoagaricus sp. SymC.cos]|nr:hypothetical protein AN958_00726 [Leucoagaricus sp. SymC.cos]